jgi:hypothetical protein
MKLSKVTRTARFFFALALAVFFYSKMDILIWQRIFESPELWDIGMGVYHWGWMHALFGFMALGSLFFYPHLRRMITFPMSLAILVFSGLEDILYYWLDGRTIPAELPWLDQNPLILKPVTDQTLILSAGIWLMVVLILEFVGIFVDRMAGTRQEPIRQKVAEVG